jgi:phosphoribosyl-ATP pyrophosphohydrolase
MISKEQKEEYIDVMIGKTARAMRKQMVLPKNLAKNLWFEMETGEIMDRIYEELEEVRQALYDNDREAIIKEAADVCNFLGFLIDNQGGKV